MQNKTNLICPECDSKIITKHPIVKGVVIECQKCGTEIEVMATDPIILAPLEEEK